MKVLLDKRIGGICQVECILNRVVHVVTTEKGKFECRLNNNNNKKKVGESPVVTWQESLRDRKQHVQSLWE